MPNATDTIRPSLKMIILMASITLAVPLSAQMSRRCYWCGPLADQVHRSQRPLPCSAEGLQAVECEPAYPHCAIVATSPPYIESRYCVKLYQDECYSVFCNTTNTWKMTCPCRGDLCNGHNTEREKDAFSILNKLVAKTQNKRPKRAVSHANKTSFKADKNKPKHVSPENVEGMEIEGNIQFSDIVNVETNNTTQIVTKRVSNLITEQITMSPGHNTEHSELSTVTTAISDNVDEAIAIEMNIDNDLDNMQSDQPSQKSDKNVSAENTSPAKDIKIEDEEIVIDAKVKTTDITTVPSQTKSGVKSPTAEALQHDESLTVASGKTTVVTIATTTMTTRENKMKATEAPNPKKNKSGPINGNIFILFSWLTSFLF